LLKGDQYIFDIFLTGRANRRLRDLQKGSAGRRAISIPAKPTLLISLSVSGLFD
jgi:hypothetical protein